MYYLCWVFFVNDTATTEIYTYWPTLSLHDALPICVVRRRRHPRPAAALARAARSARTFRRHRRSEEHTSELQSLMRISYAVFCLKQKYPITIIQTVTNLYNHLKVTLRSHINYDSI